MATVKELLEERTTGLRELADRIGEEVGGDADLQRLTQLADELSAKGDDFAATVMRAVEALQGEDADGDGSGSGGGSEKKKSGKKSR